MPASIFSTYSTGENRVTATILAVLRALSMERMERLLGAILERPDFELISFKNQQSKGGEGVPDAVIRSSLMLLIETKIKHQSLNRPQLERHLRRLDDSKEVVRVLLVLTPDAQIPTVIREMNDSRVAWSSFFSLDQAIDEILRDPKEVVSEREAFLLRELQEMLQRESLLKAQRDVVVVAARTAWPEYLKYSAYVCQAGRYFQPVCHMAFYTAGEICPLIPKIKGVHDNIEFIRGKERGVLGELVNRLLDETERVEGEIYKVMFLSEPEAKETIKLAEPIKNDLESKSGRPIAFTQGQCYISAKQIQSARTTTDIKRETS